MFQSILEPIRCPSELCSTHEICPYCLDLYPKAWHHLERCAFARQQVQLHAGGWSTPASTHILRSLRQAHFPYREPLINLLRTFLRGLHLEGTLFIPMPMGSAGRRERWVELVRAATTGIEGTEILVLITRKKQYSTRRSTVQIRECIVQNEYLLDESAAPIIDQRRVVLIDDNVTTGTTLIGGVQLLKQYHPSEIIPVVIERQVSVRLLQRCPPLPPLVCPHYTRKAGNT